MDDEELLADLREARDRIGRTIETIESEDGRRDSTRVPRARRMARRSGR